MPQKSPFSRIGPALSPAFRDLGFTRLHRRDSVLAQRVTAWRRTHGENAYLICDLQLDKWGYDPWLGSSFTINFYRVPLDFDTTFDQSEPLRGRVFNLTDAADRQTMADIQNTALRKTRTPTPEEFRAIRHLTPSRFQLERYDKQRVEVTAQGLEANDVWLVITDESDVAAWCEFLSGWLPKAVARFASLNDLKGWCAVHALNSGLLARWEQ